MKTGKSIVELATEIQRQAALKRDFIVDTTAVSMVEMAAAPVSLSFADQTLNIGETAHDQIGEHCGIPAKYYDKMRGEAPELLVANVNTWFAKRPAKQMIRTLDGQARAFLSNKYRPLDNLELAEAVLPVLSQIGVEVISSEITEKRLYIKGVDRKVMLEIPAGHSFGDGTHTIVHTRQLYPSITISNSEIGHGSLSVRGGTFDGFCTNLSIFEKRSTRTNHVGRKFEALGDITELLSDHSRRLNDAALWSSLKDVVVATFDEAKFAELVDEIKGTQDQKIEGDVVKVVEVTAQRFGMNDGERKSVLDHLIHGGDLSRFGLYNAVTRTAEDLPSYDRATEFERFGGQIIELAKNDWQAIAEAA